MKKILIMFLLSFPILIFAIVSFSASVIASEIPLSVNSLKVTEGKDIMAYEKGEVHTLKFSVGPEEARDHSFKIVDEQNNELFYYDDLKKEYQTYDVELALVKIDAEEEYNDKGHFTLKLTTTNYGFTRLSVITIDGYYEANSDIYVAKAGVPADEILGIVFDYNRAHEDFKFGIDNSINMGYTYFPKAAFKKDKFGNDIPLVEQERINNTLKQKAKELVFETSNLDFNEQNNIVSDTEDGRGELRNIRLWDNDARIYTTTLEVNASYSFNAQSGFNITTYEQLKNNSKRGINLYLLNHIEIYEELVFTGGTKVYGNGFKLDHSNASYYETEDGEINSKTRYAITFYGNNSGLYNAHVIGAINEKTKQVYPNVSNVGMIANSNDDRYMEVKDNIIENGRYNLTIRGFVYRNPAVVKRAEERATEFLVDNNVFIGSFLSAIEVDTNSNVEFSTYHGTHATFTKNHVSLTAVAMIIQNSRANNGINIVTLKNIELDDGTIVPALKSDSWRNLDDASGAFNMDNYGYLLKELKDSKYKDVYYQDGRDYYVNPLIMLRGGYKNDSQVIFDPEDNNPFKDDLIEKRRAPSLFEAAHPQIGDSHEFIIYLYKKEIYLKDKESK